MGAYLNPGNAGFAEILSLPYVDKTGLISLINKTIGTNDKLTCICRPHRFGKTYAARILSAYYYDRTCDSRRLFDDLEIARDPTYELFINTLDVIFLDIADLLGKSTPELLPSCIEGKVVEEIADAYPAVDVEGTLGEVLLRVVEHTGTRFFAIIDEWDAPIREAAQMSWNYLRFLRMLFQCSSTTSRIFAGATMFAKLPSKKDMTQSALSAFGERTMLDAREHAAHVGFAEQEVLEVCRRYGRAFVGMRRWYGGYAVGAEGTVYNPHSLMRSLDTGVLRPWWEETPAVETLMSSVDLDLDGVLDDLARLMAVERIEIDPDSFRNDMSDLTCRDDVWTLLVHLGYLSYEEEVDSYGDEDDACITEYARIPNEEVRAAFKNALERLAPDRL